MRAEEVQPKKWSKITVLFDDGTYSVIAGQYDRHAIGERWNGQDGGLGFPNSAGHPVWHIVPEFLEFAILHGLLDELARNPTSQPEERRTALVRELELQYARRQRANVASTNI